jgi:predicted RNase H-like HicB family nuclease
MKTMVHVPELLGCIANGPTTEAALEATPEAISSFLRFIVLSGERADPTAQFKTTVIEHVTKGQWLGNGSPYANFSFDLEPVSAKELEHLLRRFEALREALASWIESADGKSLKARGPGSTRTTRDILVHLSSVPGAYLSPIVGGTKGFSATQSAVERGELPLSEGIRRVGAMAIDVARATSAEQRRAVITRPKEVRTLRKALRRMLEHDWEHLVELSRRPGGPRW